MAEDSGHRRLFFVYMSSCTSSQLGANQNSSSNTGQEDMGCLLLVPFGWLLQQGPGSQPIRAFRGPLNHFLSLGLPFQLQRWPWTHAEDATELSGSGCIGLHPGHKLGSSSNQALHPRALVASQVKIPRCHANEQEKPKQKAEGVQDTYLQAGPQRCGCPTLPRMG